MKIFARNKKLEAEFLAGQAPAPESLLGPKEQPSEWSVEMLTGILFVLTVLFRRWLKHRKMFSKDGAAGGTVRGCNAMFKEFLWGGFKLEQSVYAKEDGGDGQAVLLVNYGVPENSVVTKGIRDQLRKTKDPNVLLGRFNVLLRGRLLFAGFFRLIRKK